GRRRPRGSRRVRRLGLCAPRRLWLGCVVRTNGRLAACWAFQSQKMDYAGRKGHGPRDWRPDAGRAKISRQRVGRIGQVPQPRSRATVSPVGGSGRVGSGQIR
uniref:Uncharacterized protein n=1 Tax=Aegilops tauschii subsp. strangulata TaxID=200361 RepID=A0A453C466_AEGTS